MKAPRQLLSVFLLLATAPAPALDCSRIESLGIAYTQCALDLSSDHLQLFWKDSEGQPYRSFATLRTDVEHSGKHLAFAMNAGMYEPDLSPVGLFVAEHRQAHALNSGSGFGNFYQKPNGVFLVSSEGAAVIRSDAYDAATLHPELATQSGPLLLWHGQIPGSSLFRTTSHSRHIRNGVCAPSPGKVLFVISETETTFLEFARYFRDIAHCEAALYLDGSVSSLYAPSLNRADQRRDLGTIIALVR